MSEAIADVNGITNTYSAAGVTVLEDGMLMRPLMMDFASDRTAISVNDEYMFGKVNGSYPGMIKERVFVVRIVGQEPVEVKYNGKQQSVHL